MEQEGRQKAGEGRQKAGKEDSALRNSHWCPILTWKGKSKIRTTRVLTEYMTI